jgi:hypothetical protein
MGLFISTKLLHKSCHSANWGSLMLELDSFHRFITFFVSLKRKRLSEMEGMNVVLIVRWSSENRRGAFRLLPAQVLDGAISIEDFTARFAVKQKSLEISSNVRGRVIPYADGIYFFGLFSRNHCTQCSRRRSLMVPSNSVAGMTPSAVCI